DETGPNLKIRFRVGFVNYMVSRVGERGCVSARALPALTQPGSPTGTSIRFQEADPMPLFGAHMSIAGGLHQAILIAQKHQCQAVQLFTKSCQQWKARELTAEDISTFR